MQSKDLVRFIFCLFIASTIFVFLQAEAMASSFLDEFSSIYHSNAIIEVGVVLDETGHPKDSCYLKTIKGDKSEVKEILDAFGVCSKKQGVDYEQKRLVFFYRNGRGQLRSMNLIKKGVGPYSDEDTYKHYVKMVKYLDRKLSKGKGNEEGMIVLSGSSVCKSLKKNKYFISEYVGAVTESGFSVGGESGVFKEFYPLVRIECENRS